MVVKEGKKWFKCMEFICGKYGLFVENLFDYEIWYKSVSGGFCF